MQFNCLKSYLIVHNLFCFVNYIFQLFLFHETCNRKSFKTLSKIRCFAASAKYPKMPALARATQFLAFAALTEHTAVVVEKVRLTDNRMERDEVRKEELNEHLRLI